MSENLTRPAADEQPFSSLARTDLREIRIAATRPALRLAAINDLGAERTDHRPWPEDVVAAFAAAPPHVPPPRRRY